MTTTAGVRCHKCERCEHIFECPDCTRSLVRGHYRQKRKGRIYRLGTQALYSRKHAPRSEEHDLAPLFLCEECQ